MKKVVPERHLLICDRCGAEGEGGRGLKGPFRGGMTLKGDRWWAEGGSEFTLDLCETCSVQLEAWLKPPSPCPAP